MASSRQTIANPHECHDPRMRDVILTVIAAIVFGVVCMYVLLSLAFSGWGDRSPQPSASAISDSAPSMTFVDHLG